MFPECYQVEVLFIIWSHKKL